MSASSSAHVPADQYWLDAWRARIAHVHSLEKHGGGSRSDDAVGCLAPINRSVFSADWGESAVSSDQFRRRFEVSTEWCTLYRRFMQSNEVDPGKRDAWNDLLDRDPLKASKRADAAASTLRNILWLMYREIDAGFQLQVDLRQSNPLDYLSSPIRVHVPHFSVAYTAVRTGDSSIETGHQVLNFKISEDFRDARDLLILGFHDYTKIDLGWVEAINTTKWPKPDLVNNSYVPFPVYRVFYEDERAQVAAIYVKNGNDLVLHAVNGRGGQCVIGTWIEFESTKVKMPQVAGIREDAFVRFVEDAAAPYLEFRRTVFNREKGTASTQSNIQKPSLAMLIAFAVPAEPIEQDKWIDALYAFISIELYCSEELQEKLMTMPLSRILYERVSYIQEPLLRQLASERHTDVKNRAAELSQHKAVLDSIKPRVDVINDTLARLQQSVQFVNSFVAPPKDGLFRAYAEVAKLFQYDEVLKIPGHQAEILIDHNCDYPNTLHGAAILAMAIHRFLGLEPKQVFESVSNDAWSTCSAEEQEDAAVCLLRRCNEILDAATVTGQERIARSIFAAIAVDGERNAFLHGASSPMPNLTDLKLISKRLGEHGLKSRYFEILKWERPRRVKAHQLLPYMSLDLTGCQFDDVLWAESEGDGHGFANQEPVFGLLSFIYESRRRGLNANDGVHFKVRRASARVAQFTLHLNEDELKLHAELDDPSKVAKTLGGLQVALKKELVWMKRHAHGSQNLGFVRGDFVSPLMDVLHSVPVELIEGKHNGVCVKHWPKYRAFGTEAPLTAICFEANDWGIGYFGQHSIVVGILNDSVGKVL